MTLQIVLDIDGVVADFNGALSKSLAEEGCPYLTDEDYFTWELKECVPKEYHSALDRISHRPGWCAGIPRYPNAQNFYKRLRDHGRVMAVTTAWKGQQWEQERWEWLVSFGFADTEIQIVKNHAEKYAVPADVVIEDRLETLRDWPKGPKKILINRPWNRQSLIADHAQGIHRVYGYNQALFHVRCHHVRA